MTVSLTAPAKLPGTGERFLPLLSNKNIENLLDPSDNLKHLRARYAAIRVMDVVQFVHNRLPNLSKLINALDVFRLVGENQKVGFDLRPKRLMLVWDMAPPAPLSHFDLHGLSEIVINYRVSERPLTAESFFPMFAMCCNTKAVLNFEEYTCKRKLTPDESFSLAQQIASAACSAGGVVLVGNELLADLFDPIRPEERRAYSGELGIPGLPPRLEKITLGNLILVTKDDLFSILSDESAGAQFHTYMGKIEEACGRIQVMSKEEYADRIGAQQYADLTSAEYAVDWKKAVMILVRMMRLLREGGEEGGKEEDADGSNGDNIDEGDWEDTDEEIEDGEEVEES